MSSATKTADSCKVYQLIFHNFLAAIATVVFLIGFWWFAYRFVLEEKEEVVENTHR